jgi:hypothetical protein
MLLCCLLLLLNADASPLLLLPTMNQAASPLNGPSPLEDGDDDEVFAPTASAPRLETSRRKATPRPVLSVGLTFQQGCLATSSLRRLLSATPVRELDHRNGCGGPLLC